ncbi:histone-lysine N-methyltransferase SMYD3-like [Oppia nitens]|uniref:histone-lysine N-methyltransferase SMYD3-like n=1 Tax=Oppia nitens TaxID=1686743 RepID=UPI0023DA3E6D|nr:histone-lysine N-methyltransferase SMYD3-like [Oppia nitens]
MIKAEKDYKPEDVLIECKPFVHYIYNQCKGLICEDCLTKSNGLKKCADCQHMYYCDRNCQRNDWRAGHRYECQIFKNHYQKLIDKQQMAIPMLRMYLIIKTNPQIVYKKYNTVGGQQRCFADLMSHREDILQELFKVIAIKDIHFRISSCGVELPLNDLIDMFCKFAINYFETVAVDNVRQSRHTCGAGLFIGASILDHSCANNVYVHSVGNRLQIKASHAIAAGDELTTCYVNCLLPTVTRRMQLKSRYYFDCHCRRCDGNDDDSDDIIKFADLMAKNMLIKQLLM